MKKLGFTLAEVLISLAIVGVIAALTIPSLVTEHQKRTNAAALSVAVTDFENAMSTMIMKDGVDNLFETEAWKSLEGSPSNSNGSVTIGDEFLEELKVYMNILARTNSSNFYPNNKIKPVVGETEYDFEPYMGFETKKGPVYFFQITNYEKDTTSRDEYAVANLGGALYEKAAQIKIDVNGRSQPNRYGRDIFSFYLGSNGKLYPWGGLDAHIYYVNSASTWRASSGLWSCKDAKTATNLGAGCTARLIDNGYKMDY